MILKNKNYILIFLSIQFIITIVFFYKLLYDKNIVLSAIVVKLNRHLDLNGVKYIK